MNDIMKWKNLNLQHLNCEGSEVTFQHTELLYQFQKTLFLKFSLYRS